MPEKKKHSIQSEAYEYIKKKIMMCEYLPNQLLSESILQEELGCSRTPVREAIRRLEGIDCRGKGTSCPDQFARALREAMTQRTAAE